MNRFPASFAVSLFSTLLAGAIPAAAASVGAGVNVILGGSAVSEQDSIDDTLAEGRSVASVAVGAAGAQATARGDVAAGTLGAALIDIGGDGSVGMSADFVAGGSGRVDFFLDASTRWSASAAGEAFFETNLGLDGDPIFDFYDGDPGPGFQASGSLQRRTTYTANVVEGTSYRLAAGVFTSLFADGAASSVIDAVLSYRPAAGVSLTFDDPRFLASPVPLPPGGLLLGALIGLALLGRGVERRRAAGRAA